ncbi:MAG: hypothetical protein FWG10_01095 [Eubacteriaceae bacterium]|nr:hypothetical protein [Eubacteriaceae bacterium]
MGGILDRILGDLGDIALVGKLLSLPKADLNSLLMELLGRQAGKISPQGLLKAYKSNRFTVPSEIDPVLYRTLESELLALGKENGFKAVLLSPASPLGSSSAFGYVNQNNVVSSLRGTETMPDPTNMLAIIIASKLKGKEAENFPDPLHYCATTRVLRAQQFPKTKGYYTHFGIFCIVSSGKDRGSYSCESELLATQLGYYKQLLVQRYGANLKVALSKRGGYADGDGFFARMEHLVGEELEDIPVSLDFAKENNNYYKGVSYKIFMEMDDGSQVEVGDGGFVDWIGQMTGNPKERCLISGIGLDRLLI